MTALTPGGEPAGHGAQTGDGGREGGDRAGGG